MAKSWGSPTWSLTKLGVIREYLECYQTVLKNTNFRRYYIDAFAGSGVMDFSDQRKDCDLFDEWGGESQLATELFDGSARQALRLDLPFHEHMFIERSASKASQLTGLVHEFPERNISVLNGDANDYLSAICAQSWADRRAVVFLDPFGMSVEWRTIEAIAATQAIDLWYLYPLSGVNRQLAKHGNIPESLQRRLDLIHGTHDWATEFYQTKYQPTLWGDYEISVERRADLGQLKQFVVNRLRMAFASGAVVDEPLVLCNSANSPLFLLCFAAGNPTGAPIARRFAKRIIDNVR